MSTTCRSIHHTRAQASDNVLSRPRVHKEQLLRNILSQHRVVHDWYYLHTLTPAVPWLSHQPTAHLKLLDKSSLHEPLTRIMPRVNIPEAWPTIAGLANWLSPGLRRCDHLVQCVVVQISFPQTVLCGEARARALVSPRPLSLETSRLNPHRVT